MSFLQPTPPPFDVAKWQAAPWAARLKASCQAWAIQGYGAPPVIYLLYIVKVLLYVEAWRFFCSFSPGLGDWNTIESWWFKPAAFQKAVLWSMAFEGLGLGCASGPLTGRYLPPIGGFLHFLRPGTTKLPLFPGIPVLGSHRRSFLDVVLYAAHYVFLFRALMAPVLTVEMFLPLVVLLPVLGIGDKTVFLVARAEHYYATMVCFLFVDDWLAGAMAVNLAIWLWAAVSKLNHHFPTVVSAMVSNSPIIRSQAIRKRMYRAYPDDLRPSKLAYLMAHTGIALEFTFPVLLAMGSGGWVTVAGLMLMLGMHSYITGNFPMAVPIEWNVHVVYGAFVLFGHYAETSVLSITSPLLITYLVVMLLVVPLIGNFYPRWVSFLLAMRYYAGNWAYTIWLFKKEGETYRKLDEHLVKAAPWVPDQLATLYDEETIEVLLGQVPAFRAMHLHGRALQTLIPRAVSDIEAYQYVDGEVVAGMVLGWNFGDGHLHSEQLLQAVQEQCHFNEGELRCIFIESQPLFGKSLQWRISDAKTGALDHGEVAIADLLERQPWPS